MDDQIRNAAQNTLRRLGVPVHAKAGRPPNGKDPDDEIWILGEAPHATEVLATPYRAGRPRRANLRALGLPVVWVADHIAPRVAERLIEDGDGFVDGTGNARLRLPGIVVHVLGHRPAPGEKTLEEPTRRTWRGPALRALFRLLCDPVLAERPIRDIAAAAATAPGTVVHLLEDLELTGHLARLGPRKRRFVPDAGLVDTWMDEYARKVRPKLLLGRFTAAAPDWWRAFRPAEHEALWGGEVAARLLGADLRPGVVTLYAGERHANVLRAAKLRPDAEGRVEIRRIFWDGALETPVEETTPPLLVVADLLATRDGRCRAAAQQVRKEHAVGLVREA